MYTFTVVLLYHIITRATRLYRTVIHDMSFCIFLEKSQLDTRAIPCPLSICPSAKLSPMRCAPNLHPSTDLFYAFRPAPH